MENNQPTYEDRCKQKVWPNGSFSSHRCTRKSVKDGFCKQHHPDTVKERDEKQRLKYQERIDTHPLTLAHKQIEELKQQRDELREALVTLEKACDKRNKCLTTEAYLITEQCVGMRDALYELDDARSKARRTIAKVGN